MSLNYGLTENFTTVVPVVNNRCIFPDLDNILRPQSAEPPGHADAFPSISIVGSNSVVHLLNHSFKNALPTTDNDIEYYILMFDRTDGSIVNEKIADFKPVLALGTSYNYVIDERVRIGDYFTQHEIENSSCFRFSAKRKSGSAGMGGDGSIMSYVIMSPFSMIL